MRVSIVYPSQLFYSGVKVLKIEIKSLERLLLETKDFDLDFKPILDQATKSFVISQSPLKFGIFGFMAGLFLSLMYIISRNVFKTY